MSKPLVMPRRTLQQIVHCAQEALSAHENKEDPRHVVADLHEARDLINKVLVAYEAMARGAARA